MNTRIGAYAIIMKDKQILLIRQTRGPHAGKLDFPGGGIEFGETPEQALKRELVEEISFTFDSCTLITNLTATIGTLFQIGLIYRIHDIRTLWHATPEFKPLWLDPVTLAKDDCSSLLWKYLNQLDKK